MIRFVTFTIFLLFFALSIFSSVYGNESSIMVLHVDGTIVPVIADYINRGLTESEKRGCTACIIEINTPGGLLNSTENIVQRIMNSKVPVVVYVSPHGAWAASAGTFITVSAHIAAMAPGTTIGAAHPVSIGEQMPEEVTKKATSYSAAWIRSIAEQRGRNLEELELAVTESKSFTVSEALEKKLVDLQASDLSDLIRQINGREVILSTGEKILINTEKYVIVEMEMNYLERFLQSITDPNIAYILLGLASIGLFTEISNPGLIFPGVIGGICLFISLYALGALNAYWAGILLIVLAFGLFVAELFTSTFGILTTGGVVSLVVGSLILFAKNPPALQLNTGLLATFCVLIAGFCILMIWAVVRGQRRKTETGEEGLVGKVAFVKTRLEPRGIVLVDGELWNALLTEGTAEKDDEVVINKVDGLKLIVSKKHKRKE